MARICRNSERISGIWSLLQENIFPFSFSNLTNGVSQLLPASLHILLKLHDLIVKSLDLAQKAYRPHGSGPCSVTTFYSMIPSHIKAILSSRSINQDWISGCSFNQWTGCCKSYFGHLSLASHQQVDRCIKRQKWQ